MYTGVTVLYNNMCETVSEQDGAAGGTHEERFEEATPRTVIVQVGAAGDDHVQVFRTRILFDDDGKPEVVTRTDVTQIAAPVHQRRENEHGGAGKTVKSGRGRGQQGGEARQSLRRWRMGVGSGANGVDAERTSSASSGEGGRKRPSQSPSRSHTHAICLPLCLCMTITRI